MWRGDHQVTIGGKPILSAALGFRESPGGKQQVLHRDDKYGYPCLPLQLKLTYSEQ